MLRPCIDKSDPDAYEKARRISNARFNYKPRYICYCTTPQEIRAALDKAKRQGLGVRIRSGGHHHEGLCSGDDVVMIDVSGISYVRFEDNDQVARIGTGTRLCDVYTKLFERRRILPGGGCGDVRVGGLVQGGGWGPYSRKHGLTCDLLQAVTILPPDGGEVYEATDETHHNLMWAIRGAGGGNFGVVLEYKFKLATLSTPITEFSIPYDNAHAVKALDLWRDRFHLANHNLTSFCRITAPGSGDPFLVIAGSYLGDETTLRDLLEDLLDSKLTDAKFNPAKPDCSPHPEYQPGPLLAGAKSGSLSTTCDGSFYPHKVSSAFPSARFSDVAMEDALRYIGYSDSETGARRYLSLHGMGGAIDSTVNSCFPYRKKAFMLQYQAWWQEGTDSKVAEGYMDWVRGLRNMMSDSGYTEGAFINFPDRELASDRRALLKFYYGEKNLETLIGLKGEYDGGGVLEFPMGIPKA